MPFLNVPSNDPTETVRDIGRTRVDSESSANVIKSAILRRTNEIDDPLSLPISGSTISLIAPSSNQAQKLYQNFPPTRTHAEKDRFNCDDGYASHVMKDVSPTRSIPRCVMY